MSHGFDAFTTPAPAQQQHVFDAFSTPAPQQQHTFDAFQTAPVQQFNAPQSQSFGNFQSAPQQFGAFTSAPQQTFSPQQSFPSQQTAHDDFGDFEGAAAPAPKPVDKWASLGGLVNLTDLNATTAKKESAPLGQGVQNHSAFAGLDGFSQPRQPMVDILEFFGLIIIGWSFSLIRDFCIDWLKY